MLDHGSEDRAFDLEEPGAVVADDGVQDASATEEAAVDHTGGCKAEPYGGLEAAAEEGGATGD